MHKNLRRAAMAAAFCVASTQASAAPLQACFVYVSPVGQAGWTFQHEQGRQAMQQALGDAVKSRFVESVPEGADSERVMRDPGGEMSHGVMTLRAVIGGLG